MMVGPDWSGMTVGKRRPAPGMDGRVEYDVYVTTDRVRLRRSGPVGQTRRMPAALADPRPAPASRPHQ